MDERCDERGEWRCWWVDGSFAWVWWWCEDEVMNMISCYGAFGVPEDNGSTRRRSERHLQDCLLNRMNLVRPCRWLQAQTQEETDWNIMKRWISFSPESRSWQSRDSSPVPSITSSIKENHAIDSKPLHLFPLPLLPHPEHPNQHSIPLAIPLSGTKPCTAHSPFHNTRSTAVYQSRSSPIRI